MPRDRTAWSLSAAFIFAVAGFAWWRFSENTADNDLWGHVLYGQRMMALGHVEKIDPFSWTVPRGDWINHEVLAEVALGWAHRLAGGTGLWMLAMIAAIVTLVCALRIGRDGSNESGLGTTQAALLAASANGIALGFSARPQLFTMFALVLLLSQMRAIARGRAWPLATLPLLAVIWINTHGGVLLGLVLLFVASVETFLAGKFVSFSFRGFLVQPDRHAWQRFGVALGLCSVASLATPWGMRSLVWLVKSVFYVRPEITEWRPTPLDFPHAAFWCTASISAVAWWCSRRERRGWEAASLAFLLVMAWRHQRHIPLFCLANLALTPLHLLDLFQQLASRIPSLIAAMRLMSVRVVTTLVLLGAGGAALAASVGPPKENPWTIEVERAQFPCAALHFLEAHPMEGNLLVFFDWGQQAMWALPNNRVSFDGRLDTVYPRAVIDAHWKFYRGEIPAPSALDLNLADVALLPATSAGATLLLARGWTLAYTDPLASVLVRNVSVQRTLVGLKLPVRAGLEAAQGREPFPCAGSALSVPKVSVIGKGR